MIAVDLKDFMLQEFIPVKVNGLFGGTCHLDLQSRRISHTRNQHEEGSSRARRYSRSTHRCERALAA
jgi:hypothetical protein